MLVKAGVERSKALRGTRFTEPASAIPGDSGVGVYETSIRESVLVEMFTSSTLRLVAFCALARLKPSIITGTLSAGTPLIEMPIGAPSM